MTSSNGPVAETTAAHGAGPAGRDELPERVWTLPNALSVLRLLGVPLFLWLLLGPEADGWAVIVLMVSGFTDWADGKLARWLDQGSRIGALPKFITQCQPPGRSRCSTSGPAGSQVSDSAPCSRRRSPSACAYSSQVEPGTPRCADTAVREKAAGCGSQAAPDPKP